MDIKYIQEQQLFNDRVLIVRTMKDFKLLDFEGKAFSNLREYRLILSTVYRDKSFDEFQSALEKIEEKALCEYLAAILLTFGSDKNLIYANMPLTILNSIKHINSIKKYPAVDNYLKGIKKIYSKFGVDF